MTWTSVCQAWADELKLTVPALNDAIVHLYAPYSVESLETSTTERHLAVWPEGEAESAIPFTTSPADLLEQSYVVLVWEDASEEATRRRDDEQANADWLDLHEAIRARFLTKNNIRLGDPNIMDTRYQGASLEMIGARRVIAVRFRVRLPFVYQ